MSATRRRAMLIATAVALFSLVAVAVAVAIVPTITGPNPGAPAATYTSDEPVTWSFCPAAATPLAQCAVPNNGESTPTTLTVPAIPPSASGQPTHFEVRSSPLTEYLVGSSGTDSATPIPIVWPTFAPTYNVTGVVTSHGRPEFRMTASCPQACVEIGAIYVVQPHHPFARVRHTTHSSHITISIPLPTRAGRPGHTVGVLLDFFLGRADHRDASYLNYDAVGNSRVTGIFGGHEFFYCRYPTPPHVAQLPEPQSRLHGAHGQCYIAG